MHTQTPVTRPRPVMQAMRIVVALQMLVGPLVTGLLLFDVLAFTTEQIAWLNGFTAVVVGAIAYGLGLKSEAQVTPVIDPRNDAGMVLVPANPEPPI